MAKNTSKKMKDVCVGDVLYKINRDCFYEGISELVVSSVTTYEDDNEKMIRFKGECSNYGICKSSMNKTYFSLYDGSYIGTSKEQLLKVCEKFIKKNLDTLDDSIKDMKERLDNLIKNREKVYRLYLDILTSK